MLGVYQILVVRHRRTFDSSVFLLSLAAIRSFYLSEFPSGGGCVSHRLCSSRHTALSGFQRNNLAYSIRSFNFERIVIWIGDY